ncbi:hypothetical protein C9439_00500 [archaeon SCG-AAA382B04]|nr:hypothetical protein C9439_00500 [archaeon SCG-AAA382B04]
MKFKEKCLNINDTNIHYLQEGGGEPVILIHGGNSTAYSAWKHNISSLSENAKIFSIDLPGYGKSDKPKLNYTTEKFVEFIEEFTEKKDLRNYTLIGNSMGGAIAFTLAAKSENVKKLVLVDSYGLNKRYRYIQKPVYLFLNIPYLIEGIGWNLQKLIDKHWVEWAFF